MALCSKTIVLIDYEWLEKNAEQDERANAKSLLFDMEIFCQRLWDFYYTFVKCSLLNGEQKKVSQINYSIPPPVTSYGHSTRHEICIIRAMRYATQLYTTLVKKCLATCQKFSSFLICAKITLY